MMETEEQPHNDIWFVYDGDCPICSMAARTWQIRKAVFDRVHLLNAREDSSHPLMQQINAKGVNLDDGMVILFGGNYYHGADALHIMALIGSDTGWFNGINVFFFAPKHSVYSAIL